jgi:hypothetical protein
VNAGNRLTPETGIHGGDPSEQNDMVGTLEVEFTVGTLGVKNDTVGTLDSLI